MSIWTKVKLSLTRFIPSHVNDPFGLIHRMLTSGNRAAPFTLWLTGVSILATPIDWLMQRFEAGTREKLDKHTPMPHIFICGPARSGTTLLYQVLSSYLDVSYVRNFTVAFSRSPILASRLFTRHSDKRNQQYENYYGKIAGMQAPSEANHLWYQWVDADASDFRTELRVDGAAQMADFFNNFSALESKPTLSKNNNANAFASTIAQSLENSYFICMRRETKFLAQSLLQARLEINGNIEQSYGVTNTDNSDKSDMGPVEQVLDQIAYLNKLAEEQQASIGSDRFWIVDYESFCDDPTALIQRVKSDILKNNDAESSFTVPDIKANNRVTSPERFKQIEKALERRVSDNRSAQNLVSEGINT